jgi:hypothetical protein
MGCALDRRTVQRRLSDYQGSLSHRRMWGLVLVVGRSWLVRRGRTSARLREGERQQRREKTAACVQPLVFALSLLFKPNAITPSEPMRIIFDRPVHCVMPGSRSEAAGYPIRAQH